MPIDLYKMNRIPHRAQIFLGAFWLWTWILLQFNKLNQFILSGILIWVPDNFIPMLRTKKVPVKLVKVIDKNGKNITNKLNLFLNLKWDDRGVDIRDFARYVGTTVIWAAYLLEYELSPIYDEFIFSTKSEDFCGKDFDKLFKAIIIDVSNKLIYRIGKETPDNILFGQVTF